MLSGGRTAWSLEGAPMDETANSDDPAEGQDGVEMIEVVTREVDSEGNIIVDDSVFVVDDEGKVIAQDEAITFETPKGDIIVSELGDDGEMHIIDRDVT